MREFAFPLFLICLPLWAGNSSGNSYGKLPLSFEPNRGQTDGRVTFLAHVPGYTFFVNSTEAVFAGRDGSVERMKLVGANPTIRIEPLDKQPGLSNYFIGNDSSKWRTNIPNYGRVALREVYPGIDLIFYGNERQMEYDWVVAPGADPKQIRVRWEGVDRISKNAGGDLVLGASLRQRKPLIQQDGKPIEGGYLVHGTEVGFEVPRYDEATPLVIDPVFVYSTYLGGSGNDQANGIAVDGSGNAYVTGYTSSPDFPTTNTLQANNNGAQDVFITKINAAGSARVYSTYLGGSGNDVGVGIALDSSGNAYVTGYTDSPNFPTSNALQGSNNGGGDDAFVTKLNSLGSALLYSTYLGGSGNDKANGIAVDGSGNAYLTGVTASSNFPTMNPFQAGLGGVAPDSDAFVTKLAANGSALVYSTYLGGNNFDQGNGIAVDGSGSAYVTGITFSTTFPTMNPLQANNAGNANLVDAFVTKIRADGSALVYSTYLGGSNNDYGQGIAIDGSGSAYVTGYTTSIDFPTVNPMQANNGGSAGSQDAFVAKINNLGSALVYSTYLGGSGNDTGSAIGLDVAGNAYVTGATSSTNFPTTSPLQASSGGGGSDAFVTKLNSTGNTRLYSTYLGGNGYDQGQSIAVDASGNAYVAGGAASTNFPTTNPLQAGNGGNEDAFVTKISDPSGNQPSVVSVTPSSGSGTTQTFQFQVSDTGGAGDLAALEAWFTPTSKSAANTCLIYYGVASHLIYLAADDASSWTSHAIGSASTLSNSQCTVDAGNTTATPSGNNLTLSVPITFKPGFAGSKQIFMFAVGSATNSGWQIMGNWTTSTATVSAVSVAPNAGSGVSQTFQFLTSDSGGNGDLVAVEAWFTPTSLTAANTCLIYYATYTQLIYLASDDVSTWTSQTIGTAGTLQNSQCSVNVGGATVTGSGNNLTLSVPITFTAAFAGVKQIFMFGVGTTGNSGWQIMGNWTPSNAVVSAVSVTPNSGSGSSQTFQFLASDTGGAADLVAIEGWFTPNGASTANTCLIYYATYTHLLYLADDSGSGWSSQTIGTAGVLQNSQCSLNVGGATATGNGNNLTLSVPVTFKAPFTGAKQVWMYATGTTGNSGWQNKGIWTAP